MLNINDIDYINRELNIGTEILGSTIKFYSLILSSHSLYEEDKNKQYTQPIALKALVVNNPTKEDLTETGYKRGATIAFKIPYVIVKEKLNIEDKEIMKGYFEFKSRKYSVVSVDRRNTVRSLTLSTSYECVEV